MPQLRDTGSNWNRYRAVVNPQGSTLIHALEVPVAARVDASHVNRISADRQAMGKPCMKFAPGAAKLLIM